MSIRLKARFNEITESEWNDGSLSLGEAVGALYVEMLLVAGVLLRKTGATNVLVGVFVFEGVKDRREAVGHGGRGDVCGFAVGGYG